ncbi:MAG: hypothetical protein EPN50_07035 [Chloroflexota bacterium]|nr:MAG: hypothetical protein EPN50_07035 [Chloroflexota bacterium]
MNVEILTLTPNEDPSSRVLCRATIRIAGVTIHRVALIEGRTDGIFVSPPARKVGGTWIAAVGFSRELEVEIIEAMQLALGPEVSA